MKSKSGGGFFGIFKKKTTPAPAAPPPPESEVVNSSSFGESTTVTPPETTSMAPRKGSFAQTSVIHYSPPGTVRTSLPPSATSSVVSGGSEDGGAVVITRKSNIVLDDEESVISTPISQYDESSSISEKPRSKRVAPPPPAPPAPPAPQPSSSSSQIQISTISVNSNSDPSPPPPPPHRKPDETMDYEAMLKKLQNKFEEWNLVRMEAGGSIKEERLKAEVLEAHETLKVLLEKQITSDRPPKTSSSSSSTASSSNNNNNNNVKKQAPLKMPQYGNFYSPPTSTSSPFPPAKVGAVPGGTVYQKVAKPKPPPSSTPTSTSTATVVYKSTPKTDENRNEVIAPPPKEKTSITTAQNSEAVNRLRREVEEQRQREKEVKQYRSPKETELPPPPPASPQKSSGPRMVEYKPMKSPGAIVEEDVAPPIPKTPPPKLSEYRKQKDDPTPRMPMVSSNGYVRQQVKKPAPGAPYSGPEFASSPKLLRKTPEPEAKKDPAMKNPAKEEKKVYERPQVHPQIGILTATSPGSPASPTGILTATSSGSPVSAPSPSVNYRKMAKTASVDQSGYQKVPAQPLMVRTTSVEQNGSPSSNYRKTASVDQSGYQKVPAHARTSSVEQNGSPSSNYRKTASEQNGYAPKPAMAKTASVDQRNLAQPLMVRTSAVEQNGYAPKPIGSPSNYRKTTSVDHNGYPKVTPNVAQPPMVGAAGSPSNYRKMAKTASVDQSGYQRAALVDQRPIGSPASYRKSQPSPIYSQADVPSSPSNQRKSNGYRQPGEISPLARAVSSDQPTAPSAPRKISAPVYTSSPTTTRKTYASPGILSATSPSYPKGGSTVISVGPPAAPVAPRKAAQTTSEEKFDISDVLKGPKLRKVGMPVERSGISLGKVVDATTPGRPSTTPPPPPPPPPAQPPQFTPKNPDLRDSLMSEIREAGRLRAARASQTA